MLEDRASPQFSSCLRILFQEKDFHQNVELHVLFLYAKQTESLACIGGFPSLPRVEHNDVLF